METNGDKKISSVVREEDCSNLSMGSCYHSLSNENEYIWLNEDLDGYVKDNTKTSIDTCEKEENPACYLNIDNKYEWGNFENYIGYTLISNLTQDACKNPNDSMPLKQIIIYILIGLLILILIYLLLKKRRNNM